MNIHYSIHSNGRCIRVGLCAEDDLPLQAVPEGAELRTGENASTEVDALPVPVMSFEQKREELIRRLAVKRKEIETGGTTSTGVPVFTDDASQAKLTGLLVVASANPTLSVDWKGSDGNFYTLTAAQVPLLVSGVFAHIQAAFTRERQYRLLIDAATTEEALVNIGQQIAVWEEPS